MVPRSYSKNQLSVKKLLVGGGVLGEGDDPVFKTQAEHDAYYQKQLLERAKVEKPDIYGAYMGEPTADGSISNLKGDLTTLIAIMGGIPKWSAPVRTPPANPTDWSKMDSSATGYKPEGYRYSKNRPDKESITNLRKREFGGLLAGPSHEQGGIPVVRNGEYIAEVEGGERVFSVEDTNEIDQLVNQMGRRPSKKKAAKLGRKVAKAVRKQDVSDADFLRSVNSFTTGPASEHDNIEIFD